MLLGFGVAGERAEQFGPGSDFRLRGIAGILLGFCSDEDADAAEFHSRNGVAEGGRESVFWRSVEGHVRPCDQLQAEQ